MIFLWLSILSSTGIYFIFKVREKLKAKLLGVIIINYLVAASLGLMSNNTLQSGKQLLASGWLPIAGIIGFLFVVMFFLIGHSTEKAGMSLTTIATRMSMIFPIFFSLFIFDEQINFLKLGKIAFTLIAVALAIYQPPRKQIKTLYTFLPLILFIGSGSVDTLVKTAQHLFVPDNEIQLFSSVLFGTSLLASLLFIPFTRDKFKIFTFSSIPLGIALGLANFGSLFFLMKALNNSGLDSSLVFGINNLAIVCFSLVLGFFLFKEKLSKLNRIGVVLSMLGIILLTQL